MGSAPVSACSAAGDPSRNGVVVRLNAPPWVQRLFKGPERRRSRILAVGLVGAGIVAIVLTIAFVSDSARASTDTATAPTFTYARTWSLLALQRHVQAGEVVAISLPADSNTTDQSLIAKTNDGQLVRVDLAVTVSQ